MAYQSIARHVEWLDALRGLGLYCSTPNRSPATVQCPFCGGLLFIWIDEGFAGTWASYLNCFSGDLIELSAKCWGVSPLAAITRLSNQQAFRRAISDQQINDYLRRYIASRQRAEEFWRICRESLTNKGPGSLSHRCWDVRQRISTPRYRGLQLCSCTVRQAQDYFYPSSYAPRPRLNRNGVRTVRRGSGPGASRLFPGKGWGNLLVVRFEDAPGRLCGFMFIGRREGESSDHHVYRSVLPPRLRRDRDAGVIMLGSLNGLCQDYFDGAVFVMDDLEQALTWQYRWCRTEAKPAPIIAYHVDHPPSHVLRRLSASEVIFCSKRIDAALLKLAKSVGGKVVRVSADSNGWGVRHDLSALKRRAVSWQQFLVNRLDKYSLEQARQLFLDVGLDGIDLKGLLDRLRPVLQRLYPLLAEPGLEPYMKIVGSRRRVVLRDDGYYLLDPE